VECVSSSLVVEACGCERQQTRKGVGVVEEKVDGVSGYAARQSTLLMLVVCYDFGDVGGEGVREIFVRGGEVVIEGCWEDVPPTGCGGAVCDSVCACTLLRYSPASRCGGRV
jgi:hypothetical protein